MADLDNDPREANQPDTPVGRLAHELSNLLTAIVGAVQLARESGNHSSELNDSLDVVQSATDRAAAVATRLFEIARSADQQARDSNGPEHTHDLQRVQPHVPRVAGGPDPVQGGTETIMVVEDEPLLRRVFVRGLASHGYTVLEAADGEDAVESLEQHEGPVHAIVTDVIMPKMGGIQLARRVARARPETRVLFISGYADQAPVAPADGDAPVGFLHKPFTASALASKVRELLDRDGPPAQARGLSSS